MLDENAIARAVEIQGQSYRLLRWMQSSFEEGFVARPPRADLATFCRFFSTYVEGSFDLVDEPGERLYSPGAQCFCPLCAWVVEMDRRTRARGIPALRELSGRLTGSP